MSNAVVATGIIDCYDVTRFKIEISFKNISIVIQIYSTSNLLPDITIKYI